MLLLQRLVVHLYITHVTYSICFRIGLRQLSTGLTADFAYRLCTSFTVVCSILDFTEFVKAEHALSCGLSLALHSLGVPSSGEMLEGLLLGLILHHFYCLPVSWLESLHHSEVVLLTEACASTHRLPTRGRFSEAITQQVVLSATRSTFILDICSALPEFACHCFSALASVFIERIVTLE